MDSHSLASSECRQFRRFTVRCEAKMEPLEEKAHLGSAVDVMVQDVSRTGVRFQVDEAVTPDTMWRLRLIESGFALGTIPILIRFCRPLPTGSYEIGAQFMIEPYILNILGVATHQLKMDDRIFDSSLADATFDSAESA